MLGELTKLKSDFSFRQNSCQQWEEEREVEKNQNLYFLNTKFVSLHLTTYISSLKNLYFLIIFSSLKVIIFLASKWPDTELYLKTSSWPDADDIWNNYSCQWKCSTAQGWSENSRWDYCHWKKDLLNFFSWGRDAIDHFFMWQYLQYCRTKASQPESTLPFPWVTILQWFDFQKPCLSIELTLYRQISKFCHNFLSQL